MDTTDLVLGKNCKIEKGVILGYNNLSRLREGYEDKDRTVIIGDNVRIRSGSIIYAGTIIHDDAHIGHNVLLREFTSIGKNTSIGSGCVCEGYTSIGNDTRIQAQCHLTANMSIGDYVFMGALVSTMNDKKMRYLRPKIEDSPDIGPIIKDGVAIGSSVIILPQVKIDVGAIIGAGALVTKDVPRFYLYVGNPAKKVRHVQDCEVIDYLKDLYRVFMIETYQRDKEGY